MTKFYLSDPAAPVKTLERRVKMQEAALRQAEQDLALAKARARVEPRVVDLSDKIRLLEPHPWSQPKPAPTPSEALASKILRAAAKAASPTEGAPDDRPAFLSREHEALRNAEMRRARGLAPTTEPIAVADVAKHIIESSRKANNR